MRLSLVFVLIVATLAGARDASADIGSAPAQPWRFSRRTLASARSGLTFYIGGDFDAVAPGAHDVGTLVRLGPAGTPSPRNVRWSGTVLAMADDGAGGLFVGHLDPSATAVVYSLFHVLADGTVAPGFHPTFNAGIETIERIGSTVYVGGAFTAANNQGRGRGAAFDIATGTLLPWNPRVGNFSIRAISAASAGGVYIGGRFTDVAGVPLLGLVRVHATTGAIAAFIDASVGPAGAEVIDLLTINGTLYVSGTFTLISGSNRRGLAAIDVVTETPTPFVANLDNTAKVMLFSGGRLFIGGDFTLVNGTARSHLAEIDPLSGALRPWQTQVSDVSGLAVVGTGLYLAGDFTRVNGVPRAHLAALDLTGTGAAVLPWNPGVTETQPTVLAVSGGDVAVLGHEMAYGAQPRDGLAAMDMYTGELLPFAPRLDRASVTMLDATPSAVYFGGNFTLVNGVARNRLAAVDPEGALLPWNPPPLTGIPSVIAATDAAVFIGAAELRTVDPKTGALLPWSLSTNGTVTGVQFVGTTVYLHGDFTFVTDPVRLQTFTRSGLAAADTVTGAVLPFAPAIAGGRVRGILASGSLLYVGGEFSAVGGQARPYVVAVDRTSGAVAPFAPQVNGPVDRLAERDGVVYLQGGFSSVNGVPRSALAAVTAGTGATTTPFDPRGPASGFRGRLTSYSDGLVSVTDFDATVFVWPDTALGGAPAPPAAVRAAVQGSTLSMTWASPLLGVRPTSYVIDAALAPGGPPLASIPVSGTSFTMGSVPAGLYFLGVRALGPGGSSVPSSQFGVAVGAAECGGPPAAPHLTASAEFGIASLRWSPSNGLATNYTLVVGRTAGAGDIGAAPVGGATLFSAAAPAGVYFVRAVAHGPCGISAPSTDATLVVDTAPPPASPRVTADVSGNTISISWSAVPGARGYRFEAGSGPLQHNLATVATTATTLAGAGVPPGTYYVRVVAIGATAESSRPDEVVLIVR